MPPLKKLIIFGGVLLAVIVIIIFPSKKTTEEKFDVLESGETLINYVKEIEGKPPAGRRQFIKEKLIQFAVPFTVMPFDTVLRSGGRHDTLHGENIIVTMGARKRKIVVGAHCDAVPNAPGANDNGSGVALILELIRTLKSHEFNHTVDFCFFDLEESGLIGSAVYVQRYDHSFTPVAMINLDVEGTGDEIFVGPVGGGDDDIIMKYIHEARDERQFPYEENEIYPGSDHESFARAPMENISISMVAKGDVEKLVKWTKTGYRNIENPDDVPVVLKVMHTPEDKSEYMTPEALYMSYQFTKTTLISLDDGEP